MKWFVLALNEGRKEKGAPLFGIKIQLGLVCDFNHPKAQDCLNTACKKGEGKK